MTLTPKEIAGEADSRGPLARRVRIIARNLFPDDAPGKGGTWHLESAQVAAIRRRLSN